MSGPVLPHASGNHESPPARLPGLDLMRAAAIMLVVVQHGGEVLVGSLSSPAWLEMGRLGVDAFFVLSGFLIGGMVYRAGETLAQPRVLAGFLVGRWMRTLPLYYFILLLRQVLRVVLFGIPPLPWSVTGTYAVFMQNLAWPMPSYFIESWSLAVEEWFYLLLPLFVWAGVRLGLRGRGGLALGIGVLLIGPVVLRLVEAGTGEAGPDIGYVVVYRLDAIAWGVLAAAIAARWPERWQKLSRPALALGLVLVLACYVAFEGDTSTPAPGWAKSLYLAVSSLALALVLPWAATVTSIQSARWMRPVECVARWSYSMYLTNLLVVSLLSVWLAQARPEMALYERLGWVGLYLLATIGLSAALYRWIEAPPLRWRKRLGVYRSFAAVSR